ncbi:MAG: rod shape-determining protein MreD [Mycobacteriales bacterium]
MTGGRIFLVFLWVVTAIAVQGALLSRVTLLGPRPDLVLVVVLSIAFYDGPLAGAVTGFAAGLSVDLLSDHVVGVGALVLCIAGWATGTVRDYYDRFSATTPIVIVGVASAAATLLLGALLKLLGEPIAWSRLAADIPRIALYDAVLTPFVFAAVAALNRRVDPAVRQW